MTGGMGVEMEGGQEPDRDTTDYLEDDSGRDRVNY